MNTEERDNSKFLDRLGITFIKTSNYCNKSTMLQHDLEHRFLSGTKISRGRDVEDEPRNGRPPTARTDENVERVKVRLTATMRMQKNLSKIGCNIVDNDEQNEQRAL